MESVEIVEIVWVVLFSFFIFKEEIYSAPKFCDKFYYFFGYRVQLDLGRAAEDLHDGEELGRNVLVDRLGNIAKARKDVRLDVAVNSVVLGVAEEDQEVGLRVLEDVGAQSTADIANEADCVQADSVLLKVGQAVDEERMEGVHVATKVGCKGYWKIKRSQQQQQQQKRKRKHTVGNRPDGNDAVLEDLGSARGGRGKDL